MSPVDQAIVELLQVRGPLFGLEIREQLVPKGIHLRRGSMYVRFARLEEGGWIVGEHETVPEGYGGPPRRRYRATGKREPLPVGLLPAT